MLNKDLSEKQAKLKDAETLAVKGFLYLRCVCPGGKGGCWCIVSHVSEFSCTATMWDGEYTLRINHLKPLNYLESKCCQQISDRISRLRENENLEEAARAVLKHLGELKRPYLTAVEEELLSVIEREHGIDNRSTVLVAKNVDLLYQRLRSTKIMR
ncbi:hypothetical protein H6G96_28955 [Nostoc sp. FACHB-892]|uniref:hypothetical protein n=1 Tax=Nostoc sp. FACHB-892 TaxID=2692843 RepID=UPI0016854700|nr:hypothetical protein [Nostoc sp. FACHB-892]MBD2730237.1 hypothetical protein [Nostoc sp. FACHB-892]